MRTLWLRFIKTSVVSDGLVSVSVYRQHRILFVVLYLTRHCCRRCPGFSMNSVFQFLTKIRPKWQRNRYVKGVTELSEGYINDTRPFTKVKRKTLYKEFSRNNETKEWGMERPLNCVSYPIRRYSYLLVVFNPLTVDSFQLWIRLEKGFDDMKWVDC